MKYIGQIMVFFIGMILLLSGVVKADRVTPPLEEGRNKAPKEVAKPVEQLTQSVAQPNVEGNPAEKGSEKLSITLMSGEQVQFNVEVADTPETQTMGLMNRTEMPKDHGMLFVFEQEYFGAMWMKNTYIPLDMIFIDFQGKIVKIHHLAKPLSIRPISSDKLVKAVLEINGGLSRSIGLSVGDQINHSAFN